MKDIIKFIFPLAVVCIISAIALSVTYGITNPIIEENELESIMSSLKEVLPDADSFNLTEKTLSAGDIEIEKVYEAAHNNKLIGIAAIVSTPGYQDKIKILIGMKFSVADSGGLKPIKITLSKIKIMQNLETPGLGLRIEDAFFLGQFKDRNPGQEFDTITGATVSSSAVINAIKKASSKILEEYNEFA